MSDLDDDFRLLVQGHLEGSLTRDEQARLDQLVRDDPLLRQTFLAQLRESLRCAAWFAGADGEETARRVAALLRGAPAASAAITSARVRERIAGRRRIRLRAWIVNAAAALLVGWVMLGRSASGPEAVLDSATAGVRQQRDGVEVEIGPLQAGDDIVGGLGDTATIRYRDGTWVRALGPYRVRFADGPAGKLLVVAHGQFDAYVAPQPAQRPFTMETSSARAEVTGTTFRLAADERATVLEVGSGSVRLARAGEPMIEVPAGHCVASDDPGPLAARPLPPMLPGPPSARLFDCESGTRPPETHLGVLAAGPPRPGSRWCLASEPNPDHPGNVMVWLMDYQDGLFAVGADAEVSWEYWVGDDAESLSLWLYDQEQQASYRITLTGIVHRRWTSVTVRLSEMVQDTGSPGLPSPAIGNRITSLHVATQSTGVLFVDHLRVRQR